MLKFSVANTKIKNLTKYRELSKFLKNKRKIYSFDLLSGWSCPFASECLSKVYEIDGKRKLKDGPKNKFRCFSASQEVVFPATYNLRKANFDFLKTQTMDQMWQNIDYYMPNNLGIGRIHVGGDFFSSAYLYARCIVAEKNKDRLFYAYTKSLSYWLKHRNDVPKNLILTASRGGRLDNLIDTHNLRESRVVFSEGEAKKLKLSIDHDDSHAARPSLANKSFALLIHGQQPAGSEAGAAIKEMKKNGTKFAYGKNSPHKVGV